MSLRLAAAFAVSVLVASPLFGCGSGADDSHTSWYGVGFSGDGKSLALGGRKQSNSTSTSGDVSSSTETKYYGEVRLFDVETGSYLGGDEIGDSVWDLNWDWDLLPFVTADEDRKIRFHDGDSTQTYRELEDGREGYWSVAISPDGGIVAGGGRDWKIRIWNRESGKLLFTLIGHQEAVKGLAFSPDGNMLASCGWKDLTVRLWNPVTGVLLRTLNPGISETNEVRWSPDGKQLLVAGGLESAIIDLASGSVIRRLNGQFYGINSAAWSPNGKQIATAAGDGTIDIWDAATGNRVKTLDAAAGPINRVAWSPDSRKVAAADAEDERVRVWNVASSTVLWSSK
jgi:WD40 repeat protein